MRIPKPYLLITLFTFGLLSLLGGYLLLYKQLYKKQPNAFLYANVILIKDNQALLYLRKKNIGDGGLYALVGGSVEKNETPAQAAIREAHEEAGVMIKATDLSKPYIIHTIGKNGYIHLSYFFVVRKWEGRITNQEPHRCDELTFFPLDNLPYPKLAPHASKVMPQVANLEKGKDNK